jgi:MoxR-like ATPase
MTPTEMRAKCANFESEFQKWVLGYPQIGRSLLIALLMPGRVRHVYADGMPGLAKSHTMETVSRIIEGLIFKRIQCDSDLTPSDIVGARYFDQETRKTQVMLGDIIGKHLVLADELSRATPKAQGGFLQAMAEGHVTLRGLPETIKLEDPFVLLATGNPADQKGVYPLPEAQWDRFLFKLTFPYVDEVYAKKMLLRPELTDGSCYAMIRPQMTREELLEIRSYIKESIYVSPAFVDYLYEIVDCTRPGRPYFERLLKQHGSEAQNILGTIKAGAGPRAEQCLLMASKIYAFLFGVDESGAPRNHVAPSDLHAIVNDVLRARIMLTPEAQWPGFQLDPVKTDQVVDLIKSRVEPLSDPSKYRRL